MSDLVIDKSVKLGNNVTIEPYCVIKGDTEVGDNAVIESFSVIINSKIGNNTRVCSSRICDSEVGNDCAVGPNAHLRQHAVVGNNCRIGNFVEIKNSYLGDFTKASHLAYIGDATVGKRVNIGCGVVFVNFNGREKNHTTVGDNCFLGCNVNLIAPVTLENNCFVAAGTTVDGNLRKDEFAIGRAKMTIKPNRADKYIPFDN